MITEQYILRDRVLKQGLDCPRRETRGWRYRGVDGTHPAARVGLHLLCFFSLFARWIKVRFVRVRCTSPIMLPTFEKNNALLHNYIVLCSKKCPVMPNVFEHNGCMDISLSSLHLCRK